MMAAAFLKSPELALEKTEADALAGAISEVEKHYSISLSPEARAWLGLATVGAMVYGPRAYSIIERRKREKRSGQPAKASVPAVIKSEPSSDASPTEGGPPPAVMSAADFGLG